MYTYIYIYICISIYLSIYIYICTYMYLYILLSRPLPDLHPALDAGLDHLLLSNELVPNT